MKLLLFTKPAQAAAGTKMKCPESDSVYTVKRRGKVDGRVGILIEFCEGGDIAVVDAKNRWYVEK